MDKPLVKNAASEKQVRQAVHKEESKRDRELNDVRFILSSAQGRRFYWRLLSSSRMFETSFTGNSTTFFNEGMRNVGLIFMGDLSEADPDAYIKMMKENKTKEN